MIHQPPAGARDLLPLEVVQKRWISSHLQQVFQQWGYQRIITSTIESLDTLMAAGAIDRATVIQLRDNSLGNLGLRPELTASIARASANQMAGDTYPQRLYYTANVFRRSLSKNHGRQVEFYQAGVELLGAGSSLADGEILLLLVDCLNHLGLDNWQLILGEAGLTNALLAPFPEPIRQQVRHCLATLDYLSLENLPLAPQLLERAKLMFDLRGKPADVLQKVATLDLDSQGLEIVNNLKSLVELLHETCPTPPPVVLDLSFLPTIDYYTGIIFKVVSTTETDIRVLGQGGRYDHLLAMYHPQKQCSPGIGFALNLEDLHSCLLSSPQLPQETPASDWLVIPENPQSSVAACAHAQNLRQSDPSVRIELELGDKSPEEIRSYAGTRRINHLAWVNENGSVTEEEILLE